MEIIEEDIRSIVKQIGAKALLLDGKTIVISGGAGFLGSYFILTFDYLNKFVLKNPCKVISIDNYITGKKRKALNLIDKNNIKFIRGDVTKKIFLSGKIDYIIHAAGLASPVYYQKFPVETIESAIFGVKNLLEIARKKNIKGFLYFSSSEIYGNPDSKNIPTKESYTGNVSSIGPRACYDESKRLGETLCIVYFNKYNIPTKIVRPFNVYGPGMFPDDYRVIPTFIYRALKGLSLTVHDKGQQTRTFCYISDAITGFMKILLSGKNGEVYNVGNENNEITIYDLAKLISKIFDNKVKLKRIRYPKNYPQNEPKRRCPNLSKIKKQLNYSAKVQLEEGIKRTEEWYKQEKLY